MEQETIKFTEEYKPESSFVINGCTVKSDDTNLDIMECVFNLDFKVDLKSLVFDETYQRHSLYGIISKDLVDQIMNFESTKDYIKNRTPWRTSKSYVKEELVDKILKEGQKRKSEEESICSAYVNGVK